MAEEKGTGKHPHKKTEEPWPHKKDASGKEQKEQSKSHSGEQASSGSEESGDLKEREYRDKEGNVHHHTRTSEEMKERKAS